MEYLHHGMRAAKREDGTLNAETHTGAMNKRGKSFTEALPLMCRNDESKAVREFFTKVGDKWSILLVVMLARAPQNHARFSELQRMVDGISQRMLTTTLQPGEGRARIARGVSRGASKS